MNTTENTNPVLEKIRKLLAKAHDKAVTAAEMEAFMAKAVEIATAANIDIATINYKNGGKSQREQVGKMHVDCGQRFSVCQSDINVILQKHFNVDVISMGNRSLGRSICFVGTRHDVEIAMFVNTYLNRVFPELWKSVYGRTIHNLAQRASFYIGLRVGLCAKLAAEKNAAEAAMTDSGIKNQYALTLRSKEQDRQEVLSKMFPDLKIIRKNEKTVDPTAYNSGVEKGKPINIRRGLNSPVAAGELR